MYDAVNETHDSAAATDKIVNTSVSGDGTWEQNGFSSFISFMLIQLQRFCCRNRG